MTDTQRTEQSIRRTALTLATLARQLEAFLRASSGPVDVAGPAGARSTQ